MALALDHFNARDGSVVKAFAELGKCPIQLVASFSEDGGAAASGMQAFIGNTIVSIQGGPPIDLVFSPSPQVNEILALIIGVSNTPIVAHGLSTGAEFSDADTYPTFARVVASDRTIGDAAADFVSSVGWDRVGLLTTEALEKTQFPYTEAFEAAGIAVHPAVVGPKGFATHQEAQTFLYDADIQIFVVSCASEEVQAVLEAADELNLIQAYIAWVFVGNSEALDSAILAQGARARGAVSLGQVGTDPEGWAPRDALDAAMRAADLADMDARRAPGVLGTRVGGGRRAPFLGTRVGGVRISNTGGDPGTSPASSRGTMHSGVIGRWPPGRLLN